MSPNPFGNTFLTVHNFILFLFLFSFELVYLCYHHNDKLTRPQASKNIMFECQ